MITPVYGPWCSKKTTESQRVFTSDRTPSKPCVLRPDAIVGKTANVLGCGLEGVIPEVSVLCEFANSERVVGKPEIESIESPLSSVEA